MTEHWFSFIPDHDEKASKKEQTHYFTDDDTLDIFESNYNMLQSCENCEQLLEIDEMNYSEQLDTYYCDACCDSMEQDECDAGADHMMSVMEAMD